MLSCEMVICGDCWVKAWMTRSPRAREVMKFGSPVKASSAAAGVGFGLAGGGVGGAGGRGWRGVRLMRGPFPYRLPIEKFDRRTTYTINAHWNSSQQRAPFSKWKRKRPP